MARGQVQKAVKKGSSNSLVIIIIAAAGAILIYAAIKGETNPADVVRGALNREDNDNA